jgi:hypothetical protein
VAASGEKMWPPVGSFVATDRRYTFVFIGFWLSPLPQERFAAF